MLLSQLGLPSSSPKVARAKLPLLLYGLLHALCQTHSLEERETLLVIAEELCLVVSRLSPRRLLPGMLTTEQLRRKSSLAS